MSTATVQLTANDSKEALLARIAELETKAEKKGKLANALSFVYGKGHVKVIVSDKGGISFYGFNVRFPLTVYKQALLCLLDHAVELRKFIADNEAVLSNGKDAE